MFASTHRLAGWLCVCVVAMVSTAASAGLIYYAAEGGYDAYPASATDLINSGQASFVSQSNSGASLYASDPTGIGLNNGTVYSDGGRNATESGRTYCPANGSSITFNLNTALQPAGYTLGTITSISGGDQARRSQKFRLEYSTVGDASFVPLVNESQINFVSNAGGGEMRVVIRDDTGAALATGVDQVRVTYFDTGASLPQSMYRELDIFGLTPARMSPPAVTSAALTARFDAGDVNRDGGLTSPPNGGEIKTWSNLVSGQTLNDNSLGGDGKPSFVASAINGQPAMKWEATTTAGDLMFNNAMSFQAQTIIAVTTMKEKSPAGTLATLLSDQNHNLAIRQTTSATAAYFSGNSADFIAGNGAFTINGTPRFDIPGGFATPHVVKAVRNSAATYSGFRLSDNVDVDRRWNGEIAEILVYNGVLNGNDTAHVNKYLIDKYAINQVVDERVSSTSQIANEPFLSGGNTSLGVNFHYGTTGTVSGTLGGIAFNNINLAAAGALTGTFPLTASALQATLSLNFNFTSDNSVRTQGVGATGPGAATLDALGFHMFYLSSAPGHQTAEMLFSGLRPLTDVYVQVIGGDSGWNGDVRVLANGRTSDWTTVADGNGGTASLLGFFATTDSLGRLDLDFSVFAGNFAGISGVILTENVPEPASLALLGLAGGAVANYLRRRRRA